MISKCRFTKREQSPARLSMGYSWAKSEAFRAKHQPCNFDAPLTSPQELATCKASTATLTPSRTLSTFNQNKNLFSRNRCRAEVISSILYNRGLMITDKVHAPRSAYSVPLSPMSVCGILRQSVRVLLQRLTHKIETTDEELRVIGRTGHSVSS